MLVQHWPTCTRPTRVRTRTRSATGTVRTGWSRSAATAPRGCRSSPPELAIARQVHTLSVRSAMADALDLRHRLPLTWARVRRGECEPWVARKVASMSRQLDQFQVRIVDGAVADAIGGESPARVLELAQAKVIEADPTATPSASRPSCADVVGLSRSDEHGLRNVIARVEAEPPSGSTPSWTGSPTSSSAVATWSPTCRRTPATRSCEPRPSDGSRTRRTSLTCWRPRPRRWPRPPYQGRRLRPPPRGRAPALGRRPGGGPRATPEEQVQRLLGHANVTLAPSSTSPTGSGSMPTSTPRTSRSGSTCERSARCSPTAPG